MSVVDGLSRSLEFLGRWESLPVVGGLSGSLTSCFFIHISVNNQRQESSGSREGTSLVGHA